VLDEGIGEVVIRATLARTGSRCHQSRD